MSWRWGSTIRSRPAWVIYGDLVSKISGGYGGYTSVDWVCTCHQWSSGFVPQNYMSWEWWYMLAIPTHTEVGESEVQGHPLFISSWKPLWDQWNPCFKNKQESKQTNKDKGLKMWLPEHLPTYHELLSIADTHEYVNKKDIVWRNTLQLEDMISQAIDH